jgi:hypothetical protein
MTRATAIVDWKAGEPLYPVIDRDVIYRYTAFP